jgi:glycosyltransferase involved in cell wall biosynthesis
MEYPLVSAIVLCYNQAKFVEDCLEGIRQQRYPNLDLVVNDDASGDDSAAVIKAWLTQSGMPHRFFRSASNQGLCRSLNHAISQSRGKYIAGIAADDAWLPGKLLNHVEKLERLPGRVGVIYTDAMQIDESGKPLAKRFIETYRQFEKRPQGSIHRALWQGNFIPAMTTLIRRECFDKVGLFDESLYYEDWDMWLRISRCFEFAYVDEVSAKYRVVSTSMMRSQSSRMIDAGCQICFKHLRGQDFDGETRIAAAALFYNYAICSYEHKTPGHKKNLLRAFRFRPTPGLGLRCLFALCGMGSGKFASARRALRVRRCDAGQSGESVARDLPSVAS